MSHSPQPYSKFKLQANGNNLMVYGQNGKPSEKFLLNQGKDGANNQDSRTLGAPPLGTRRNPNGYPLQSTNFDKNTLSKNSSKNIERYQKGTFVGKEHRRNKAHSNNTG